jgi:hypothetical protein
MSDTNWVGPTPTKCDNCNRPITHQFVDGKTKYGPWGILCMTCHEVVGVGLGIGKGQMYLKEGDKFIKMLG